MPNTFEANHCLSCPKVFCCPECRCKHERAVHNTGIICAMISKSPRCNNHKKFRMNSKKLVAITERISEPTDNECSPKAPSQDDGNVKQVIAKFFRTTLSYISNDKEKKSVSLDTSVFQHSSQQFAVEVGATSTPCQINILNKSVATDEPDISLQENINQKKLKEVNKYEITYLNDVPELTDNSNSKLNINGEWRKYGETQSNIYAYEWEISDLVTISMTSRDIEFTDTPSSKFDNTWSSSVANTDSILEECDNMLNEETDSQGAVDRETASSFSGHTENSSDQEESSTSPQCLQVFKLAYSDTEEYTSVRYDSKGSLFNRSSSIADLSQGVWQSISNSIRSALNSTKDFVISLVTFPTFR